MTDNRSTEELIEETLRLDVKSPKGPWIADEPSNWCGLAMRIMSKECPTIAQIGVAGWKPRSKGHAIAESIASYRTSAPRLARMLRVAMKALQDINHGVTFADRFKSTNVQRAVRKRTDDTLTEIEKIAKGEA